jgi:TolB-like protein
MDKNGIRRTSRGIRHTLWIRLLIPLSAMILSGCISSPGRREIFLRKDALPQIKRIAVIPFDNLSDRLDAEVLVTTIFIGEIDHSQRFSVLKYGDIREFLLEKGIRSTEMFTQEILHSLAQSFSIDGVMLGTIMNYREWNPDRGKEPAMIHISARLLDCESGRIIWCGQDERTGWDERIFFDIGETVFCSQLVQKTARKFLRELDI